MKDLKELLATREPLCEELSRYVQDVPSLGRVLRHPLVFSVPYFEVA